MQGYQVCLVGSAAFAIAVDPLKLPRLPHLIDEVLIQRHFKRRGQLHLVAFHFEYLNGRGFEFFGLLRLRRCRHPAGYHEGAEQCQDHAYIRYAPHGFLSCFLSGFCPSSSTGMLACAPCATICFLTSGAWPFGRMKMTPCRAPLASRYFSVRTSIPLRNKLRKRSLSYGANIDRKSTRLNSSHSQISYAVFCLKKKKNTHTELSAV